MENVDGEVMSLFNVLLSEEQLDMKISEVQNLKLLIHFLKLKKRRILEGKEQKINYHVDKIFEEISEDLQLQCEVLKIVFFITQNLEEEIIRVTKYLNFLLDKVNTSFDFDLAFKIVQILNEILIICTSQVMKTLFQKNMSLNNLDTFLYIGLKVEITLRVYILSTILPNYINLLTESRQLLFLSNSFLECRASKNLDVLCITADHVKEIVFTNSKSLLFSYDFWEYLENCITSENTSIHKQGIFLLKKWVQAYYKCKEIKSEIIYLKTENMYNETSDQVWHNFFTLYEASKEKQLHLIWPALTLLNSLKYLHPLWQTCVYKKLLAHTQNSVVYFVALHILNNDLTFPLLNKYLLSAVNKHEYSTDSVYTFKTFPKFCNKINMDSFIIFLEDILEITWTPAAAWCLVSNLFADTLSKPIPFKLLEAVFQLLKHLPHMFIRKGCISVLLNYFIRHFNWKNNIDDSLKMLIMIKNHDNNFFKRTVSECMDIDILNIILSRIQANSLDVNIFEVYIQIIKNFKYEAGIQTILEMRNRIDKNLLFVVYSNFHEHFDINEMADFVVEQLNELDDDCIERVLFIIKEPMEKQHHFTEDIYGKTLTILKKPREYNQTTLSLALQLSLKFFEKKCDIKIILKDLKKYLLNFGKTNDLLCTSFLSLYLRVEDHPEIEFLEHILHNQSDIAISKMFQHFPHLNFHKDIIPFHKEVLSVLPHLTKSRHFKSIVCNYINCLFSQNFMDFLYKTETTDLISLAIERLLSLSETFPIIDYYVSKRLKEIIISPDFSSKFSLILIPAICELLLTGTVIKKDDRIEYCVCQEIYEKLGDESENPNFIKTFTRMAALESMLRITSLNPLESNFAALLIKKYKMYFNKRYFPDSQIHLQKLRIVQALLTILPFIYNTEPLIDLIMESFCTEIHQTCVRQLMQWLLIGLLKKDDHYFNLITTKIDTTNKAQPSSIVAFIVVLFHLTISRDESFWFLAMEALIPWSMGAHFKLRVYSQAAIKKLLEEAKQRQYQNILAKYGDLEKSILSVIEASGSAFQEALKSDELIFTKFRPAEHFSLETIYVDIPKLNGVTRIEWENILQYNFVYEYLEKINVENKIKSFSNAVSIYIENKVTNKEIITREFKNTQNIQRKIIPCKITVDQEKEQVSDFILIASLIDKPTNLGGLSRTCEVFGVKQLVLNDVKAMKDKEFKSLSMSSEDWVSAVEIKSRELNKFICDLRRQGYTVVGAEQTSDSICLHKYKFKKKTALVLGNEKEGIPSDIIPILDTCVEIPQFGMVRSLNVHVAGAMFIWEYAKQKLV